jgi:uncharacterized protein YraI
LIPLQTFLSSVQKIVDSKPYYKLGQDGSQGECDCIGMVIGAFRRSGATWSGTHGSNWAARNKMITLQTPAVLELGAVVFKAYEPGDKANTLPDTYKNHPDQRDYYHVGVITRINPLQITHCTGGTTNGIKMDSRIGAWRFGGRIDGVDYTKEAPVSVITNAVVTADSGSNVRLRAKPSVASTTLAYVPLNETVGILNVSGNWTEVQYKTVRGWMMSKFLQMGIPNVGPTLEEKVDVLWEEHLKRLA